jgi:hypothetical protein
VNVVLLVVEIGDVGIYSSSIGVGDGIGVRCVLCVGVWEGRIARMGGMGKGYGGWEVGGMGKGYWGWMWSGWVGDGEVVVDVLYGDMCGRGLRCNRWRSGRVVEMWWFGREGDGGRIPGPGGVGGF